MPHSGVSAAVPYTHGFGRRRRPLVGGEGNLGMWLGMDMAHGERGGAVGRGLARVAVCV